MIIVLTRIIRAYHTTSFVLDWGQIFKSVPFLFLVLCLNTYALLPYPISPRESSISSSVV